MSSSKLESSLDAYRVNSQVYAALNDDTCAPMRAQLARLVRPGCSLLDAGCGHGRDLREFSKAGYSCVGVDAVAELCVMASEHAPVLQADLRSLPLARASFDVVWANASLVHLGDDDVHTALLELARVGKPQCVAFFSVKSGGSSGWRDSPVGRRWFRDWNVEEFARAVESAGFIVDQAHADGVFANIWAHLGG